MNNKQRAIIEKFSIVFRETFDISVPINDFESLVKKIGGTIQKKTLEKGIDGKISKTGDSSFLIEIKDEIPENRERFTIAHELGHLIFDMGYLTNEEKWKKISIGQSYHRSDKDIDKSESIANEFAATLLMPRDEFYEVFIKYCNDSDSTVNISKVAEYFHVSEDAALTRAKWLGFVSW